MGLYGVPVILHTDHCMRDWLPWFDGLLEANEDYFAKNGEPLFSSHMLDMGEDPLEENIATCVEYLERMSKSNLLLEMELGITGGEEDGVDNSDVDSSKLYTQPEEVWQVYEALSKVPNGKFRRGGLRQRPRRLLAGQRPFGTADPPQHAEVHLREARRRRQEAGVLRLPRRLRVEHGGHPVRDRGRHDQDEHRHGHAVVVLGRHPRVRGQEPRLPPAADRQPRRRGQAEQEVLRPPDAAARRRGGDRGKIGQGDGGPEVRERVVGTYKTAHCSLPS